MTCHTLSELFSKVRKAFLAAIFLSGLWKTPSAQEKIVPQFPVPTAANLFGVHFNGPDIGYAVGDESTVLKTRDGGKTWLPVSYGGDLQYLDAWFTNADTGYVTASDGTIATTRNGGVTWSFKTSSLKVGLASIHFPTPQVGFAVGVGGAILKTTDGGNTAWQEYTLPSKAGLRIVRFANALVGYAAGEGGVIYKTVDGGARWDSLASGTNQILHFMRVFGPDSCLVIGDNGEVLTTGNGGAAWALVPRIPYPQTNHAYFLDSRKGVAFSDEDLYRTLDGGTTWDTVNNPTRGGLRAINFSTPDVGVAVGYGGLILRTANGGADWLPVSVPQKGFWRRVWTFGAGEALAVGGDGFMRTSDGGTTWDLQASKFSGNVGALHFPAPRIGYLGTEYGFIYKTADGGARWAIAPGKISGGVTGLCFPTPEIGYAVTDRGGILKTTDGSRSWSFQVQPGDFPLYAIEFPHPDTGYAAGANRIWYRTSDGGATWEKKITQMKQSFNDFHFLTGKSGFAIGQASYDSGTCFLAKTEDHGETWTHFRTGVNAEFMSLHFLDAQTGYIGGKGGAFLKTMDGGRTWNRLPSLGKTINSIHFSAAGEGFAVGEDATLMRIDPGPVALLRMPPKRPLLEAGWAGYPWYRISRGGLVRMRLFDARGNRVLEWPEEMRAAGYHRALLPDRPLVEGVYLLDITSEGARRAIRIRKP